MPLASYQSVYKIKSCLEKHFARQHPLFKFTLIINIIGLDIKIIS